MATIANERALDRPVWSALTTGDRRFAQGGPLALRFPPDIAPFGATADDSPEAFAALSELLSRDARVALVSLDQLKPYPGLEVVREAPIVQMVALAAPPLPPHDREPIVLGAADVPEMLDLAERDATRPLRSAHARAWSICWGPGRWRTGRHGWRAHAARWMRRDQRGLRRAPNIGAGATPRSSLRGSSKSSVRRASRLSFTCSRTMSPPSPFTSGWDSPRASRSASRCCRAPLALELSD